MANSTSILDYLGRGTHAARPTTPPIGSGTAVYYETDTGNTFAWSGSAWVQVNSTGGGGGGGTTTPPFTIVQYQDWSANFTSLPLEQTATAGNTLLVLCACDASDTPTLSGYTQMFIKAQASYSQLVGFIKTAAGTETSVALPSGVNSGNNPTLAVFEIAGTHTLDVEATTSKVPGFTTGGAWIAPPAITPASGAMVFAATANCSNSANALAKIAGPNWTPLRVHVPVAASRCLNLWVYDSSGAASSLQPPIVAVPVPYDASTGLVAATFSIK